MIRRLLKESAIYGVGQLIYLGLPIIIIPIYSRLLEPHEFGVLELIVAAGTLVNFVVTLEIGQGMGRYYLDTTDPQIRVEYASTALLFSLGAYGAFLALSMAFIPSISSLLLGSLDWEQSVQIGLVAVCATGLFIGFQNQLRWQLTPWPFLAASITHAVASTAVSVLLLTQYNLGPSAVLYGQIAGATCGAAISAWHTRLCYRLVFCAERLRKMLLFSAPLVLSSISIFLLQFIDRFIIKELVDMSAVGIYSVGFRLASTANLLLLGLNASLTPLIFEKYREPGTPAAIARIFRGFIAGTLPLLVVGSLFAKDLLALIAGPEYLAAWSVIPLLAFASVLARMYIFAPGIDILKKTHLVMVINVGSAILNVVLCYALIPRFGILGAALAAPIAAGTGFVAYMALSQKFYPVPHDWSRILAAVAVGCLTIALGAYLESGDVRSRAFVATIKVTCVFVSTAAILWLLRRESHSGNEHSRFT